MNVPHAQYDKHWQDGDQQDLPVPIIGGNLLSGPRYCLIIKRTFNYYYTPNAGTRLLRFPCLISEAHFLQPVYNLGCIKHRPFLN